MLLQLEIHNVALIDKVSIEMGRGLNILTGETGAGKSIIIDSINAVLGERTSKELIRSGSEKALVEAAFSIEPGRISDIFETLGIEEEEDGTLIISREFNVSGKNTCRVNGKLVTVSNLKELGERLIDVHGQHDNQSLLRVEGHIELLDLFGGEVIRGLKQKYRDLLSEYREIRSRLKKLSGDQSERERKLDLLKYQQEEIKKAKLKTGEDEELEKQRLILSNSEKIAAALEKAYSLLYSGESGGNSAVDILNTASNVLSSLVKYEEKYGEMSKRLEALSYELDDITDAVRNEKESAEYNPGLLEHIEERIDLIYRLKKKYGSTIPEVLQYLKKTEDELQEMLDSEEIAAALQKQLGEAASELYRFSSALSMERSTASKLLEESICKELEDLEMKKSRFKVDIRFEDSKDSSGERRFLQNGLDRVEFLISPNAGEPLKPLSKIASGGEMSRVMLAIKTILAKVDSVPTMIFDEIDAGVSGKAAQKVGEKLAYISKNHQVICVTHLAQIAAMADNHYKIEKTSDSDTTRTRVKMLCESDSVSEIARIIGGANISDITIKYAEEMVKNSLPFRSGSK